MPNVLRGDLPDDVDASPQRRAQPEGKPVQQDLATELTSVATTPTLDGVFERIGRRRGGAVGFAAAVRDLDTERRPS